METILMNTENSKTNKSHIFRLILFCKLDLKNLNKDIALVNISIYYTCENIISAYNNYKFKISAPTWNDEFDLSDGSYSISDIQEYFLYITKKDETITNNPQIQIYTNKIKNHIVFKIQTGYKWELLSLIKIKSVKMYQN